MCLDCKIGGQSYDGSDTSETSDIYEVSETVLSNYTVTVFVLCNKALATSFMIAVKGGCAVPQSWQQNSPCFCCDKALECVDYIRTVAEFIVNL